jgi:ribosomal protein L29
LIAAEEQRQKDRENLTDRLDELEGELSRLRRTVKDLS